MQPRPESHRPTCKGKTAILLAQLIHSAVTMLRLCADHAQPWAPLINEVANGRLSACTIFLPTERLFETDVCLTLQDSITFD